MKPGSTLGFSHGFLLKYLEDNNVKIRDDINIVGICPKGMGNTVRTGFLNGNGINLKRNKIEIKCFPKSFLNASLRHVPQNLPIL